MNNMWEPEYKNDLTIKILAFLLSPVLGMLYSLYRLNTKSSFLILFLSFTTFGFSLVVPETETDDYNFDSVRYRAWFEEAADDNINDFKDKFVAIKIHFGEAGNIAYLRPNYAARLVDLIRSLGGKPFLTDSNTLYSGSRSNAVDHLDCAMKNGYDPMSANANVIIADGLKGTEYREIPVNGKYCPAPKIGSAIADADIFISMNHFKGHEQTGFGGALKNIGMGSASRGGKLELHSESKPVINTVKCRGCNVCVKNCAHGAITLNAEHKAVIESALSRGFSKVFFVGNEFSAVSLASDEAVFFQTSDELAEYLKSNPVQGATVLIKGSRGTRMEKVIPVL